jgi:hypothetical protein
MKRLRIAMVKMLKIVWDSSEHLVIPIADGIFRKIIMTDSIKTAALNALCYNKEHMDTSLQKSSIINFRSLTSQGANTRDPK